MDTTYRTAHSLYPTHSYAHDGSRDDASSNGASGASSRSTYIYDPSLGSKPNDPIVQGYALTIPADQKKPEGQPELGGFRWQQPAAGTSLWGVSGPAINDINQGSLGDCYFDAALGSVVNSPSAAAELKKSIKPSKTPGLYDVHFYAKDADGKPHRVTIQVNANQLTDASGKPVGNRPGDNQALYLQIMEKAYGICCNQYPNNTQSGAASSCTAYGYGALDDHTTDKAHGDDTIKGALFALTGEDRKNIQVSQSTSSKKYADILSRASSSTIIANTKTSDATAGLAPPHVYNLLGYDGATAMVILRDPHGTNRSTQSHADGHGTFEISLAQFQKHFAAITELPKRKE